MRALFIVCGHIGVGKTTAARLLGEMAGAQVVSVDETIHRLFEAPSNRGIDIAFSDEELKVCYNAFALVAERVLALGSPIIVDGCFSKKAQREKLIAVAKRCNAPFHILRVTCPDELVKERTTRRFAEGRGVGWQGHLKYKERFEELERADAEIDSSKDVRAQLEAMLARIGSS